MNCLIVLGTLFLCAKVNGHLTTIVDVRIDHHKVETIRDLIVNTARPKFSWKIRISDNKLQRNVRQTAYQIQLQSIVISQRDELFEWDSNRVLSSQSIHVQYVDKNQLLPSTYYRFRIRIWIDNSSNPTNWIDWIRFRTAIFNLNEYFALNSTAVWIGSNKIYMNELRKEFNISNTSPMKSAIVYVSGIGYYEFYLNGYKVDESRKLDPAGSTYEKRTFIVSFDVTNNITIGANAIGIKLGNGWFSQDIRRKQGYGPPRLLFTLLITFENGDTMNIVSDQTWSGRDGSIKQDDIYNGEIYDARYDRENWTRPDFVDLISRWITPDIMPSPTNITGNGSLSLLDMPPIRSGPDALHFEVQSDDSHPQGYLTVEDIGKINGRKLTDSGILKPIAMWKSQSLIPTFDLGQNFAGICRYKFRGSPGMTIHMRYGEVLTQTAISSNQSTRNVFTENLEFAIATDVYTLRGNGLNETYEPTFTYHGFRYISLFDLHQLTSYDDIECRVVHSETTLKGHFISSNPIINQIQHNIQWGQLSNLMSWPSDNPARIGRQAWLGDAAVTVDEALYNFDLIKFYHHYLDLITDVQEIDGELPDYIPGDSYPADPNWGTALPTITWQVYRHYNDVQTLKTYYKNIVSYVQYLQTVYNETGLANFTDHWNDWAHPSHDLSTNPHLVGSYGFLHDVYLLLNMSRILDQRNDTEFYSNIYEHLAEEFHRVFFNSSTNYYADGSQAAQIFALALPNVVPASVRQSVFNQLVFDINQKGIHVSTGIISISQLFPLLSDNGHHDLALELISSTTYPSFGYMFSNPYENATTLWEEWSIPVPGPGTASRNHIMFGSVGAWFYTHLAGIDISSNFITIRPRMVSEQKKHLMSKLHCQLSTLYGTVQVSYTRDERDTVSNSILLHLTIPANTQACVIFEPLFVGAKCKMLKENETLIWSTDVNKQNSEEFRVENDPNTSLMTVHIGSGEYEFHALWTN